MRAFPFFISLAISFQYLTDFLSPQQPQLRVAKLVAPFLKGHNSPKYATINKSWVILKSSGSSLSCSDLGLKLVTPVQKMTKLLTFPQVQDMLRYFFS